MSTNIKKKINLFVTENLDIVKNHHIIANYDIV